METFSNLPELVHRGLPRSLDVVKLNEDILGNRLTIKGDFIRRQEKYTTHFSGDQQIIIGKSEQFIQDFYNQKLSDLGIPRDSDRKFPRSIYLRKMPHKSMAGGYSAILGLIVIEANPEKNDLLVIATANAHENSHAVAKTKNFLFWNEKNGQIQLEETETVGMPSVVRRKDKAILIEEGLSEMDTADFFTKFADKIDHRVLEKRQGLRQNKIIKSILKRLNNSIYGRVDFDQALPYIWSEKYILPILGIKVSLPYFGEQNFKVLRVMQELCRTVGYETSDSKKQEVDFVKVGRDLLDKSRIAGSREGLEKIVQIFGFQARKILDIDKDFKGIDSVMKLIRQKQKDLGLMNLFGAGERIRTSTSY